MVESFKGTSIDYEHDKRLGVWAYAKEAAWTVLPPLLLVGSWIFGRATNYKVFPLDGSPSIVTHLWEKTFTKVAIGQDIKITNKDRWGLFLGSRYSENVAKDLNNVSKAAEVVAIPTAYHLWHKKEENRLDLTQAYDRLQKLDNIRPSDTAVAEENASLKAQLAFVSDAPKPHLNAASIQHEGRASEHTGLHK